MKQEIIKLEGDKFFVLENGHPNKEVSYEPIVENNDGLLAVLIRKIRELEPNLNPGSYFITFGNRFKVLNGELSIFKL